MIKKFAALFMVQVLVVSLAACSDSENQNGATSGSDPSLQSPNLTVSEKPDGESTENMVAEYTHLSVDDTAADLVNHPAFAGFGQFMLAFEGGIVSLSDPLGKLRNPKESIGPINSMMDMVSDGQTIFYDIYTDEEKQEDPTKESTGLFFFRGEPGAPFAVICAGGAFITVDTAHESFPHALELSEKGYNAFALKYRVGGAEPANEDLAAALSFIFEHADEFEINTEDYSLWGTSAGARVAAYLGSHGAAAYGGDDLPRPAAVVMVYTAHSDYTENDPPTFVAVGDRDGIAPPSAMERRVNNLKNAGVDVEFHVFPNVGHAFGLGIGTSAEGWLDDAVQFWEKYIGQ